MQAMTYSEARHALKNVMDEACSNHEPILITRRKGENVVLLSLEDYESIRKRISPFQSCQCLAFNAIS